MKITSYGGGTNSTAMLIEFTNRGIIMDRILFADTGAERPHTYAYVENFSKWLQERGQPAIHTVRRVDYKGNVLGIEEWCLSKNALPPIAYGFKTCSMKFKPQPVDKFLNNDTEAKAVWKSGGKLTKYIGFDADEHHRVKDYDDAKYIIEFPLVEWGWGRDECLEAIEASGLCMPGNSACWMCPSSRVSEIRQLAANYPELAERAIAIERNADLTTIKGLGRQFSWENVLSQTDMFDEDYATTPEMVCGCYDG